MSAAKNVHRHLRGAVCTTPVSGSAHDKNGTVTASPTNYGTCNDGWRQFEQLQLFVQCAAGTPITLTNSRSAVE